MRIGFFLSDYGGSPLVVGLQRGLEALGHRVEPFIAGEFYDLVVIFNQCAHTPDYVYPDFPSRLIPIAFVDTAEYGYFKRLPGVVGEYWNAFAPGSMAHENKNRGQQERLQHFLEGRSFPYFLREFSKYIEFPDGYYPIDYPLYLHSECHQPPDREEYLGRQRELFCSWGASHPWRMQLTEEMEEWAFGRERQSEIRVLQDDPRLPLVGRMPQATYFERTRASRCSVSFDGYGSGSFRMTEVLCRTVLLQGPLSIRTHAPLVYGETCVGYGIASNGEEFCQSDIRVALEWVMRNPEAAFEIYERGYAHCHEHLTETATARYFLDTVAAHDWGKVTPLTPTLSPSSSLRSAGEGGSR